MGVIFPRLLAFAAVAVAPLAVAGCILAFPGDHVSEDVPCFHNTEARQYEISLTPYAPKSCKASLIIPDIYTPRCIADYPAPPDRTPSVASLKILYPGFGESPNEDSVRLEDGEILIFIHPVCGSTGATLSPADNEKYIESNKLHAEPDGSLYFAPIRFLGDGIYLQENIRRPYLDGNSSHYFYRDGAGAIPFYLSCDGTGQCFGRGVTEDGLTYYDYRIQSIGYRNFKDVDARVRAFVSGLAGNQPAAGASD